MAETNEFRAPIGEVLPDTTIGRLPEGHEAVTVWALIKVRDPEAEGEGEFSWCWRSPEIVNHEELLGALISQTDLLRQQMLNQWDDGD